LRKSNISNAKRVKIPLFDSDIDLEDITDSLNALPVHEPSVRASEVEAIASLESEYVNVLFNEEENKQLNGVEER